MIFVLKKGFLLVQDFVTHQLVHIPFDILLLEIPVSVFSTVGNAVIWITGTTLPAEGIGLVIVYPIIAAIIACILETPSIRLIAGYWTSMTLVTGLVVAAGVGMVPDPAGAASGLEYHLRHHTLARVTRQWILIVGYELATMISTVTSLTVDESIGLVAFSGVSIGFGIGWEVVIGHDDTP